MIDYPKLGTRSGYCRVNGLHNLGKTGRWCEALFLLRARQETTLSGPSLFPNTDVQDRSSAALVRGIGESMRRAAIGCLNPPRCRTVRYAAYVHFALLRTPPRKGAIGVSYW